MLQRKRAPVAAAVTTVGTVKLTALRVAPPIIWTLVAICSPASVRLPLPLKSIHALRKQTCAPVLKADMSMLAVAAAPAVNVPEGHAVLVVVAGRARSPAALR